MRHAFVIPAFGKSAHLPACIRSIAQQSVRVSQVVLTTSTPSEYLFDIASQNNIQLMVNPVRAGIASDWNFALTATSADLLTIAHQDDTYAIDYAEKMIKAFHRHQDAVMAFSNSVEHTPSGLRLPSLNLKIKRLLCYRAFGMREAIKEPSRKRRLLTLGNPVCCPSVVFNRTLIPDFRFFDGLKSNLDWEAWANLADGAGKFVYLRTPLVSKQVHADSETSALIANKQRILEDRQMFNRFWPKPVAVLIARIYKLSYMANRI